MNIELYIVVSRDGVSRTVTEAELLSVLMEAGPRVASQMHLGNGELVTLTRYARDNGFNLTISLENRIVYCGAMLSAGRVARKIFEHGFYGA